MFEQLKNGEKIRETVRKAEELIRERTAAIDEVVDYNTAKVLGAFQKNKVSDAHFNPSHRVWI